MLERPASLRQCPLLRKLLTANEVLLFCKNAYGVLIPVKRKTVSDLIKGGYYAWAIPESIGPRCFLVEVVSDEHQFSPVVKYQEEAMQILQKEREDFPASAFEKLYPSQRLSSVISRPNPSQREAEAEDLARKAELQRIQDQKDEEYKECVIFSGYDYEEWRWSTEQPPNLDWEGYRAFKASQEVKGHE